MFYLFLITFCLSLLLLYVIVEQFKCQQIAKMNESVLKGTLALVGLMTSFSKSTRMS